MQNLSNTKASARLKTPTASTEHANAAAQVCLEAQEVGWKAQNVWRLQPLSLQLFSGEILAVCGPNGAGKSTLLGLLSGELKPASGQVLMQQRPLSEWNIGELARQRARMEQENPLNFDFSVEDVVALGRYAWGDDAATEAAIVSQAMQAAGAADLRGRKVTHLSGGERQRVQLARVLAQVWQVSGAVVLLDEPMSAQDLGQQQQLLRNLQALSKSQGWSLVCVLHDLNLAAIFADRVLLLNQGRKQGLGSPAEVLEIESLAQVYKAELTVYQHQVKTQQLVMLDD